MEKEIIEKTEGNLEERKISLDDFLANLSGIKISFSLSAISLENNTFSLLGESQSALDFMKELSRIPMVKTAHLGEVKLDRDKKEVFSISGELHGK